jgi:hypothetical protein
MRCKRRCTEGSSRAMSDVVISRRAAVSVGLGLLAGSAFAREGVDEERLREAKEKARQGAREAERQGMEKAYNRMLERDPESRAFFEQMSRGGTVEERMNAMRDWQYQRSMESLKAQLGVSDEEWKVVQPRIATAYNLRHPPASFAQEDTSASAMVSRLTRELRELLNNKDAKPEEIKTKLTALRAAKVKVQQELTQARQQLRQILTIRQEAVLVLGDLLD